MMHLKDATCVCLVTGWLAGVTCAADAGQKPGVTPKLVSVRMIWDKAKHSAFTDLIRHRDRWLCTFREADAHGYTNGVIRVIESPDGETWTSAALLSEKGRDLRDPKLSHMPDGRLMMLAGSSLIENRKYVTRSPRVAFSEDGKTWSAPRRLLAEDHWLWRATWHKGVAWCASKLGEGRNPRRGFLYRSRDGIDWEWITEFKLEGVSETTLRFMPNDEMIALVRPGYIGHSMPPYKKWTWHKIAEKLGGPNFIRLPDGSLWGCARRYHKDNKRSTMLARMTRSSYEPVLALPSGGDTSYAGMIWNEKDNLLWMSYYSSHESKTKIYLAKIRFER